MYLIWSHEHNAWWKSNQLGYTSDLRLAGHYDYDEAAEIVLPHIPPGEEVAVLETYAQRWQDEQEKV